MQTSWIPSTGAILLTAILAGSAGTANALTTVAPEYLARTYQPELVLQSAGERGLFLDVRASGGAATQELADGTRAAMRNSRLGRATPLHLDRQTGAATSTKLVVLFDPAPGAGHEDACRDGGETRGGSVSKVMMTLCHDGEPVSSVTAQNSRATRVGSPAFADMIRQAATTVFPNRGGDMTGQTFWNHGLRN
jgi:hypothetical protein